MTEVGPQPITEHQAIQIMKNEAYREGYETAQREAATHIIDSLLFILREELARHPYEAPGLHTAIDRVKGYAGKSRDEWREYLDEEDYELMYTMSWDHPGEVRWIPPVDEGEESG